MFFILQNCGENLVIKLTCSRWHLLQVASTINFYIRWHLAKTMSFYISLFTPSIKSSDIFCCYIVILQIKKIIRCIFHMPLPLYFSLYFCACCQKLEYQVLTMYFVYKIYFLTLSYIRTLLSFILKCEL